MTHALTTKDNNIAQVGRGTWTLFLMFPKLPTEQKGQISLWKLNKEKRVDGKALADKEQLTVLDATLSFHKWE